MPSESRRWWILCVLCGAGVVGFAVWFGGVIPTRTCTGPLPSGVSALLAFQLSRTPADIDAVFGPPDDPCRATMVAALDRANTVDLIGFIATYGAFFVGFFLALLRAGTGAVARVGLAAIVAALAFDVLETSTQLRITNALPGSPGSLSLLAIGSTGKFLGLAVMCICAGIAMIRRGRIVGRLAGVACIAGGLMVLAGLIDASALPVLSAGTALGWIVILLYAVAACFQSAQRNGTDPRRRDVGRFAE